MPFRLTGTVTEELPADIFTGSGAVAGMGSRHRVRPPAESVQTSRFLDGENAICVTGAFSAPWYLTRKSDLHNETDSLRLVPEEHSSILCRPDEYS